MFKNMLRDTVELLKKNGNKYENIKASVQGNKIYIMDGKIPIEEGDEILRIMPNGLNEMYAVVDRGFIVGLGSIPSYYKVTVEKSGGVKNKKVTGDIYNINGPNAKVNINSNDSSINIINDMDRDLFVSMAEAIKSEVKDNNECERLMIIIENMAQAKGSKGFNVLYQEFVQTVANHIAVITPFIPALTKMLIP